MNLSFSVGAHPSAFIWVAGYGSRWWNQNWVLFCYKGYKMQRPIYFTYFYRYAAFRKYWIRSATPLFSLLYVSAIILVSGSLITFQVLPWKFKMTCNLPVKFYVVLQKILQSCPKFNRSKSHSAFDGKNGIVRRCLLKNSCIWTRFQIHD